MIASLVARVRVTMSARWYVVRVDAHELTIVRAAKKPIYEKKNFSEGRCFVDGAEGEDGVAAGGYVTGFMKLDDGF
jgi:hypothetical protein